MTTADPTPPTAAEVDALVGWSIIRAAHRVERDLTALLAERGLTPVQFGVLATLATTAPCTQAELARTVLVRPQSIAGVVTTMIRRGLLARTGPGGRGRPTPLTLTDRGRQALTGAWAEVAGAHGPARLAQTEAQTRQMLTALAHLTQAPEAESAEEPGSAGPGAAAPSP